MVNRRSIANQEVPEATQVETYLQSHPDFLDERPELLTKLDIPHPTADGVSSLIERQVGNLRQENRRYRLQLESLTGSQNDIRQLSEHVHRISLAILESQQPASACALLHDCMRGDYAADAANLFLFLDHDPFDTAVQIDVRERNDKLRLLLTELFHRNRPLIDSLQTEYSALLFGAHAKEIHASILIPIGGYGWDGLIAVGSRQRDRYRRGPELELLVFLAGVTAFRLDQWLQSAACSTTA